MSIFLQIYLLQSILANTLIKKRSTNSSEVQLFLQVHRRDFQMTSFWFPTIWMCLFSRFSASLPVSCVGHLNMPSH